jgi:uncharacterized protein (DUF924 family)
MKTIGRGRERQVPSGEIADARLAEMTHSPEDVLREWFRDPERWWMRDAAFDDYLRATYGDDVEAAIRGDLDDWADSPRAALALVILLDQFTRNLYRGTPRMYAGDAKAAATSLAMIERGADASFSSDERQFLYMPLMHSEDRALQRRSLEKFRELGLGLDYAEHHAEIVLRFGRFPHRNAILGRDSTREELEFLDRADSSFY